MRPADQHLGGAERPDAGDSGSHGAAAPTGMASSAGSWSASAARSWMRSRAVAAGRARWPGVPATWSAAPASWRGRRSGWECCGRAARLAAAGGVDDQRLELPRWRPRGRCRAAPGGQQHAQRRPVTAAARRGQAVLAERFAGGADRVQHVTLGAAAVRRPLGSTHLDDPLAALLQRHRQTSAEAARPSTAQQQRPGRWSQRSPARRRDW
jgi:hypothetical protein